MDTSGEETRLVLEGFPKTPNPQADIKGFFHQYGIQIREVGPIFRLTISNTPAWILTLETGQDVNTILQEEWKFNGYHLYLQPYHEDAPIPADGAEDRGCKPVDPYEKDTVAVSYRDESGQATGHESPPTDEDGACKSVNPYEADQEAESYYGDLSQTTGHEPSSDHRYRTPQKIAVVRNPQTLNMQYGQTPQTYENQHHLMTPCHHDIPQKPSPGVNPSFLKYKINPSFLQAEDGACKSVNSYKADQEAESYYGDLSQTTGHESHFMASSPQTYENQHHLMTPCHHDIPQKQSPGQPIEDTEDVAANQHQSPKGVQGTSVLAPRCDIERDFKMSKTDEEKTRSIEVYDGDLDKGDGGKYLLFFQNSPMGGGEIEAYQISEDNVIIIMFKEKKVADHFLEKGTATVGNTKVRIKPHEPFPVYTNKVLLQYPGAHLDRDAFDLVTYIKARSKCEVQRMESGTRQDALIVSFKESVDAPRLQEAFNRRPFREKTMVKVHEVKAPCTLHIKGVPSDISQMTVQDYFEGGVQYDLEAVPTTQQGSYLVHFSDFRDAVKLAETPHRLKDCVIEVALYHKEIMSGQMENRDKGIKESFVLDVSPLYGRFIKKTPSIKSKMEKNMKDQGMDFSITKDNQICLAYSSCQRDQEELVKSAKRILYDLVDLQSIEAPHGSDAESLVGGILRDQSDVKIYIQKRIIFFVGCSSKTSEIQSKIKERINLKGGNTALTSASQGTEEQAEMKTENMSAPNASFKQSLTLKPLAVQYLFDHSFQTEVEKRYNGVKLSIDVDKGEVIVEGQEKDTVQSGQILIHGLVNSLETTELQTISEQQSSFLNSPGVRKDILDQQKERGIVSSWKSKKTSLEIIARTRQAAEASKKFLIGSVIERIIPLEPNMFILFASASWKNELQKLVEVFQDKFSITPMQDKEYLLIVGLNDNIDALCDEICSYLEENVVQEAVVPLQKGEIRFLKTHMITELDKVKIELQQNHGQLTVTEGDSFIMSGPKLSLEKATEELKRLSRTVHRRREILTKPGMAKLMNSDKGNVIRHHVESKHRCIIETEDETALEAPQGAAASTPERPVILAVSNLTNGRKICVRKGDITSFTVDALVIAANNRLDSCGGLAKAIFDNGGKTIEEECSRYIAQNGILLDGEAIVSSPGTLPCHVLIHAVGPEWKGGNKREEDYLQEAVLKSLEFADKKGCVSIAIPGLSTGVRGYPPMEATKVITKAVDKYFKGKQESSVKDVYFCDRQDSTLDAFIGAMDRVFGRVSKFPTSKAGDPENTKSDGGCGAEPTGRDVVVVTGEIAKLKAEVIVNSASDTLNLTQGAVSKSLLDVAGPGLQDEVSRKRPTSIKEVIVTNGYNLHCEKVYHVRLPEFKQEQEAEKEINDWVQKCLDIGNTNQSRSMMFPALGTGNLNYPRDLVAERMIDTIRQFWMNNPRTLLTDIRVVLYDKDDQTKKAFDDVKSRLGERASQKMKPVLKRGNITRFDGDVIVNASDESWDLNRGSLSKSISDAAGPSLSAECQRKYPHGCPKSGVAVTTAGRLNAKNIYHVFVPSWKRDPREKNLMDAVKFCLEEAHANNHRSILFPTLGVGLQGYNNEMAARCMFKAIDSFWTSHPGTSLTGVQIVIFDDNTAKAFEKKLSTFFSSRPVSRKNRKLKTEKKINEQDTNIDVREGVTIGNIHFRLVYGDLLKENVDCVVCSVNPEFDLDIGIINGILLQRFPSSFSSRDGIKAKELKSNGYTVTQMSAAPFQLLLHFFWFSEDLCKILKKCFKVADELKCNYVALPELRQGPESGLPERILMEHLYDTLIKLKDLNHVKEVRLVLFEEDVYERFMLLFSELVKKQGLKAKRFFKGPYLKEAVVQKLAVRPTTSKLSVGEIAENSVHICFFSDIEANIESAKQELLAVSDKEFHDKNIENLTIALLNKDRMEALYEEARRKGVVLTVDVRLSRCRVKGIKDDVFDMINRIYEMCIDQKDDDSIDSTVQWCYIDETAEEELGKYDKHTNKCLEKTYREGKERYRLQDEQGKWYIVDFVKMVEFMEDDPSSECAVLRKDLLNAEEVDFPGYWESGVNENLKIIRLDPKSMEFQRVDAKFAKAQKQIIKIERIQNKTLYRQYKAKKKLFEQRSTNTKPVEQELWHGTAIEAIPSINKEGFNRSFCGKNAVVFGNGVYFAVDPSYSIQDRYAWKDTLGNQYIYLVDVLTGEYTNGKTGMRVPPPRDPKDTSVLFDSVVDKINAPTMYIIFNDTQAYPKYLITFK